jgi:hypothetical protein
MNNYVDIIIEALRDYRCWFTDQGGSEEENERDELKVKEINEAIEYIMREDILHNDKYNENRGEGTDELK